MLLCHAHIQCVGPARSDIYAKFVEKSNQLVALNVTLNGTFTALWLTFNVNGRSPAFYVLYIIYAICDQNGNLNTVRNRPVYMMCAPKFDIRFFNVYTHNNMTRRCNCAISIPTE